MTLRYLLDTDVLSLLQRAPEGVGKRIHERIRQAGPAAVGTSIVAVEEQLRGRFDQVRKAESRGNGHRLCEAYTHFREAVELFREVTIVDYSVEADMCYRKLRGEGGLTPQKVRPHDLRIGCIALAGSLIVVTANRRDFERIPGVVTEDWTRTG